MARSPSRSSDGGSAHHMQARAEPRLLKAIEDGSRNDEAIAIIEHAKATAQSTEKLLGIGLMRAAERGNTSITEYLLKSGAKPDGATVGGRLSPLLKAVEKNHVGVVQLLLKYGGNVDASDKQGRTALMTAAWRNHLQVLEALLRHGADINKKDKRKRNVLHNLAADKHCNWGRDIISVLLEKNIAIDGAEGQDELKRSPLHWAAVTGKFELCEMLLKRPRLPRAHVNAVEIREKTSLHLAVSHEKENIVELLLRNGADVKAKSDGSWTALHNACEKDNVKILKILLEAGAELNAKLLNGMTPLHVAAQAGHIEVVRCLLERKDLKRAARDNFGITPFLRAAQEKRKDIVALLAPFNNVDGLSQDALGACQGFNATIVDFGNFHNGNKVTKRTVYELLYGRDPDNQRIPAVSILPRDSKATSFRWIHLPANNMAWVEALLTKAFIEEGASDVEGFKALERSFSHQHRGQQIHSHFMRPLCQSTPRAPKHMDESDFSDSAADTVPPRIVINESAGLGISTTAGAQEPIVPKKPKRTETVSTDQTDWTRSSGTAVAGKEKKEYGKGKEKTKKSAKWSNSRQPKAGGTDTPTKQSDSNSKKGASQPMTSSGHLRSPGSPGRKDPTSTARGNIFTFMPYLHFETNRRRREMQAAIQTAEVLKKRTERSDRDGRSAILPALRRPATYDEMLLRAHLSSSTASLHVRRTLDQFFYHNIDTQSRDEDQVVYRYQMKDRTSGKLPEDVDPKIFMVDQLWMWVLGKDLIVTSFPQRWQQPKNDPLNVLDGIIEDINSKTREPVRSVYDLALIISGRCIGVFDRNRMDEDYQFMDMFESSIGDATEEETKLFRDFNVASAQASQWLRHHRRPNRFSRHLEAEGRVIEHANKHSHTLSPLPTREEASLYADNHVLHAPLFVDNLLDIGAETDLLAETKDIRDELNMIAKVLEDQRAVLPDLELSITDIYREEHKSQSDMKRRFREHLKTIDTHTNDIARMDKQAERIYKSITDLLDLKQKHANAFEARFARDQAAGTARQGQTIMVFTIVTIVFLPLSFIASIMAINVREFPHGEDKSEPSLPFSFVARWMFGIGFGVSIPLVALALSLDAIGDTLREIRRRVRVFRTSGEKTGAGLGGGVGSGAGGLGLGHDKPDNYRLSVDTHALELALSAGRSTMGARRSYESNPFEGSLLPVTSRGTASNINGHGKLAPEVVRPVPVERMSTGFKLRRSGDVERGAG